MKNFIRRAFVLMAISLPALAAEDLIQFEDGEIAVAADVNANFTSLDSRLSGLEGATAARTVRLITDQSDANDSSPYFSAVVSVSCAQGESLVGSAIRCVSAGFNDETTNYGAVFSEEYLEDGLTVVGSCIAPVDAFFSDLKLGPTVVVQAQCLGPVVIPSPPPSSGGPQGTTELDNVAASERLESIRRTVEALSQSRAAARSQ